MTNLSTGIAGLDTVLGGGLPRGRMYLVLGAPGTGKTTLGLQFLLAGAARGERVLYISLSEMATEIEQSAAGHGWSLEGVELYELGAAQSAMGLDDEQRMFDPADVEFRETSRAVLAEIERHGPQRVVFDSLSELSLLSRDTLAFRREVLTLKRTLIERGATALLLTDATLPDADRQLESLAHGVLQLEELSPDYGPERRRLRLRKLRGRPFQGGFHDFRIHTGGVVVYPRLVASGAVEVLDRSPLPSGITALDELSGGGLARGASTMLLGPSGCGKSSLLARYASSALERGEPVMLALFDERPESFLLRARGLGMPLEEHVESGRLRLRRIDPAAVTPGELAHEIRAAVEEDGSRLVGIDSLNGYMYAMPQEGFLTLHLHELLTYLSHRGVTTLFLMAQHGLVGPSVTPVDLTYVADAVLLIRFFESRGRIARAISMLKKRHGRHEDAIRELRFTEAGIEVGDPLDGMQGVLSGVPTMLMEERGMLLGHGRSS